MAHPDLGILIEARTKAERLVSTLGEQWAQLQAHPPAIPPEKLAEGRAAMQHAIASARRALSAINEALEIALTERAEHN